MLCKFIVMFCDRPCSIEQQFTGKFNMCSASMRRVIMVKFSFNHSFSFPFCYICILRQGSTFDFENCDNVSQLMTKFGLWILFWQQEFCLTNVNNIIGFWKSVKNVWMLEFKKKSCHLWCCQCWHNLLNYWSTNQNRLSNV